jgi:hypothetical protein
MRPAWSLGDGWREQSSLAWSGKLGLVGLGQDRIVKDFIA